MSVLRCLRCKLSRWLHGALARLTNWVGNSYTDSTSAPFRRYDWLMLSVCTMTQAGFDDYYAVMIRLGDKTQVLAVDRLLDSRKLLVNSPGRYARHVRGVAGLSILGDGAVAVNLDLAQLLAAGVQATAIRRITRMQPQLRNLPSVLIVDDSLSVRNSLLQLLQDAEIVLK